MTGHVQLTHQLGALALRAEFALSPGLTAIFGPSGAGKTSILRAMAGLLTPDAGKITVSGRDWLDTTRGVNLPTAKRGAGYVFQTHRLFPHFSVDRNLSYGQRQSPAQRDALVEMLGLGPLLTRMPRSLSGGEAQRVALARALLTDPNVLLMDEPLSALDQARKREIYPYLDRLRTEAQIPILYVSHDLDEVTRLADQVILMEAGQTRPPQALAQAFAGARTGSALDRTIAGGLLLAQVVGHDTGDRLTELRVGAQALWLPGQVGDRGDWLQLRVDARDVMIATRAPQELSALNTLPARIAAIDAGPGSGALVRLTSEGQPLAARLTHRSVRQLGLAPGQEVFAVLKTMAVTEGRVAPPRSSSAKRDSAL